MTVNIELNEKLKLRKRYVLVSFFLNVFNVNYKITYNSNVIKWN